MENTYEVPSIISRIEKLEKKNKSLIVSNLLLILIAVSFGLFGFQNNSNFFKMVETEKLIIKDSDGKVRVVLGCDSLYHKPPKLELFDMDGKTGIEIGLRSGEGSYQNFFYNGLRGLFLDASDRGGGISVGTSDDKYDINELHTRISYKGIAIKKAAGTLCLGSNPSKVTLYYKADGPPQQDYDEYSLRIYDKDYVLRSHIGFFGYGDSWTAFRLFDKDGNLRAVIGQTSTVDQYRRNTSYPESSIFLFNEKGNSIFNAP